jgi:CRP/FNR family transcriptional regulator, cyclic AMP receptor protein
MNKLGDVPDSTIAAQPRRYSATESLFSFHFFSKGGSVMSRHEPILGNTTRYEARTAVAPDASDISAFNVPEFLLGYGEGKSIRVYRKRQNIFGQGEVANTIFYLQLGRVKVSATSEQGKGAVVGIVAPGHFLGEGCLTGRHSRATTATAMDDCVLTSIDKMTMLAALRSEPKLSETFMVYLLTRNSRIEDDIIDQIFNSCERRLARRLLLLANFAREGSQPAIDVTLNQETLAEMIGTTRSRVNFFMNKFRKLGYISYDNQNANIEVHTSLLDSVIREKSTMRQDE